MVKPEIEAVDIDPKTGTTLGFYTFGTDRPNILIVSGIEGHSASCVYTNYLLMKFLEDIDRIDGSVTILPVANPLAFRLGVRVSPLDSQDLDTVFPGSEHGTVTERIAREIWRRASQAEQIIHIRSSPQICISQVVALHREYIHVRNFASQLGLKLVVQSKGLRGALSTEAAHEGLPAVTLELSGNRDRIEPQSAVEVREAIINFLRIKDMISGKSIETSSTFTATLQNICVDGEGFFVPLVHLGDEINVGDLVGRIQDSVDVISQLDGMVASLTGMKYVFEGDTIARIATNLVEKKQIEDEEEVQPRRKW